MELPDNNQIREFTEHLFNVHSWYKHIPLLNGMKFYVFLSGDSGENYPLNHPKLKFGNDLAGYRKQFGYLDYVYSEDGINFHRDGGKVLNKEDIDKIKIKKSFILYPYVHDEIYWNNFGESLEVIADGMEHDHAEELTEVYHLYNRGEDVESDLSWDEFDLCTGIIDGDIEIKGETEISDMVREYLEIKLRLLEIHDYLKKAEREKIDKSVKSLIEEHSS